MFWREREFAEKAESRLRTVSGTVRRDCAAIVDYAGMVLSVGTRHHPFRNKKIAGARLLRKARGSAAQPAGGRKKSGYFANAVFILGEELRICAAKSARTLFFNFASAAAMLSAI